MAMNLVYLGAICHEDLNRSANITSDTHSAITRFVNTDQLFPFYNSSSNNMASSTTNASSSLSSKTLPTQRSTPADRTRSLVSMYSTSIVFSQNRMHHMKTVQKLPLSVSSSADPKTIALNSLPTEERLRMMTKLASIGTGRQVEGTNHQQVQTLVLKAKTERERASSMFALVV